MHPSDIDMDKFYRDCIPKSSLPSDFGGDCESVEMLHKKHCEELLRLRKFFLAEEKQANGLLDTSDKGNLIEGDIIRETRNFKNISID